MGGAGEFDVILPGEIGARRGYRPAWMLAEAQRCDLAVMARPGVWALLAELYYEALPLAAEQAAWWRSEGHGTGLAWQALGRPVPLRPDWGAATHLLACRWAGMMLMDRIEAEGAA